ncbi:ATP12 [Candida jiufengensis]|uniref:ATP12 n=1 Tax=Candida jiufengensis TaxID=497108 RepID=UPI002224F354|nr:ATP12 [Candida jiufengensis]KAI5953306.1 ATP12 [Candida jiufengensis]
MIRIIPTTRYAFTTYRSFSLSSKWLNFNKGSLADKSIEHNTQSETNRLAKTGKRFWDKGNVLYNESTNKYEVQLDGKTLRTPLGLPLILPPTKKQLAYLISHEWTNLQSTSVKSSALPLTELAARAIDLESAHKIDENENEKVKEIIAIDDLKMGLLKYLDTDTCLIFAGIKDCDGLLRQRQDQLYLPLIKEYNEFFTNFGHQQNLLKNDEKIELNFLDCEKDGLRGNKQSLKTKEVVMNWLNKIDIFELIALEKTVLTTKSFLCGTSILRSNVSDPQRMQTVFQVNKNTQDKFWYKSVEEIIELGNLETIIQTSRWGEVEDTHDVEQKEWLRSLAGAALVSH